MRRYSYRYSHTMSRTCAPRRRLDLSPVDEGGPWLRSGRTRRQVRPPPPPFRQYKLSLPAELAPFNAVRRLEEEHPGLSLRVFLKGREFMLAPKTEESAFVLARVQRDEPFGITLEEVEVESRGVLLRYPVGFPLEPIEACPHVLSARRCSYRAGHGRREPTRQVEVRFGGKLPDSLDLGSWGVYSVRRHVPEPPRCYHCQAFGHVQKHCGTRALCGVCSGCHPTSECISALKAGERRAARCPNCGKGHHAWHKLCPERLRRLPQRGSGRGACPQERDIDPQPLPAPLPQPVTATATDLPSKRRRRGRRRSRVAPAEPVSRDTEPQSMVSVASQTDPPPPPPKTMDAAVQATPACRDASTAARPPRRNKACQVFEGIFPEAEATPTAAAATPPPAVAATPTPGLSPALAEFERDLLELNTSAPGTLLTAEERRAEQGRLQVVEAWIRHLRETGM